MDNQVVMTAYGLDHVVLVIGPSGFRIGIIGVAVQVAGGAVLFADRRKR